MFLCVAAVAAAGVGLLVQHRKLGELRRGLDAQRALAGKMADGHKELVDANGRLAGEVAKLRKAIAGCESERDALRRECERTSGLLAEAKQASRTGSDAMKRELSSAREEVKAAIAVRAKAEAEVKRLAASVESMSKAMAQLRKENSLLESELNDAMSPAKAAVAESPEKSSAGSPAEQVNAVAEPPLNLTPPPQDKLTPKEREARRKAELDDLIGL